MFLFEGFLLQYIRHLDVHSGPVKMHHNRSTSHSSPFFWQESTEGVKLRLHVGEFRGWRRMKGTWMTTHKWWTCMPRPRPLSIPPPTNKNKEINGNWSVQWHGRDGTSLSASYRGKELRVAALLIRNTGVLNRTRISHHSGHTCQIWKHMYMTLVRRVVIFMYCMKIKEWIIRWMVTVTTANSFE